MRPEPSKHHAGSELALAGSRPVESAREARANRIMRALSASTLRPPLLDTVDAPHELRTLPEAALSAFAAELREYLLAEVSRVGGHLSASLGVVELTVALHYVFDTPRDALVWDVGHQGYPHKILTGRRKRLDTIRRRNGLAGFLSRDESEYDVFGAGHSSTSISAALGLALAEQSRGSGARTVAIIGDGGMTAGLAFEALQHAGSTSADLLIVLNDNGMSISPNVGGLSRYLERLTGRHGPSRGDDSDAGAWFEELGVAYLGPCDGHDLPALVSTLRAARDVPGPRLLHVVTRKGHGYAPAEADPIRYHGVSPFDPATGIVAGKPAGRSFTDEFSDWLCEAAALDPRIVAITPAMREGSGLVRFAQQFPDRYFDVGIAEQHCVTLAAGLAARGLRPVVAIYSTFLQRAYDQLIHDVALQRLPVLFAIDRAGLVGPDGATHAGSFDLTYLRCVPGLTVMTPSDAADMRTMLQTGIELGAPAAVRYPRGNVPPGRCAASTAAPDTLRAGAARIIRSGSGVALLVFGTLLDRALTVADELDATVVDMRFVKPLDTTAVLDAAGTHELLVTIEENAISGGAGSAVGECLAAHGICRPLLQLGLPDVFPAHGTRDEALRDAGLDVEGIRAAISRRRRLLANNGGR